MDDWIIVVLVILGIIIFIGISIFLCYKNFFIIKKENNWIIRIDISKKRVSDYEEILLKR